MKTSSLDFSVCIMSGCGSVYPLSSAAGGSLSGDNCTRHQCISVISLSVVHQELFVCLPAVFGSILGLCTIQFPVPCHPGSVGHGPQIKPKIGWPSLPQHSIHVITSQRNKSINLPGKGQLSCIQVGDLSNCQLAPFPPVTLSHHK